MNEKLDKTEQGASVRFHCCFISQISKKQFIISTNFLYYSSVFLNLEESKRHGNAHVTMRLKLYLHM